MVKLYLPYESEREIWRVGGNGPAYKSVLLHILTRINSDPKENS